MPSRRIISRLFLRVLLAVSLIFMFYCEVLIYHVSQLSWKDLPCTYENCTKILFVADPQILGDKFDTSFYSPLAKYDSDRFLQKTFERAVAFSRPDIICFLGDLLDEGSVASYKQYSDYVQRFKTVFQTDPKIQRIHVPGDNDIGGENGEYISNTNVRRFEIEFMNDDLFDYENRLRFFKINRMIMEFMNPDRENNADRIRIGLSHMPMLIFGGPLLRGVLNDLDPHVIFSGHWHESRIFFHPGTKSILFYENGVKTFDLEKLKNEHTYLEIMVPTSSYRMGKPNMGFGYGVFENNNLYYTILWSSNRFIVLISYIIWIVFAISMCIIFYMMTRCPCRVVKNHRMVCSP